VQKLDGHQDASYTYAWTAVSKPPWLTALGLCPKGNCWDGGGLFTRLLFRFLSLLPFLAVWLLIWLPLSKARESIPDQTRIA
jgi:hypothetical protein